MTDQPTPAHLMGDDLLDACGTAAPGSLHVTPVLKHVTCVPCGQVAADRALARRAALAELLSAEYDHAQERTTQAQYEALVARTQAVLGTAFCDALADHLTGVKASPEDMRRAASNPIDTGLLLALVDDQLARPDEPPLPPEVQALINLPAAPAERLRPDEQVAAVRDALTLLADGDLTADQALRVIEHVTGWQR